MNENTVTLEEAERLIDEEFGSIVGQTQAKRQIKSILMGAVAENGYCANCILAASVGYGKSRFLRAIHSLAKSVLGRKRIYFESGAETGSPASFFEETLIPFVHQCDSILFIDECHASPTPVKNILRDLIDPNIKRTTKVVRYRDGEVEFNPFRNAMFLASNKVDELDSALLSRLEMIQLIPYADLEMEEILWQGLAEDNIIFNEQTLKSIAECNRGSARDSVLWINAIRRHVALKGVGANGQKTINKKDCADIIRSRQTLPRGVTLTELNTLVILEKYGPQQLRELAAKNQCSSSEQVIYERHLKMHNFIRVEVKRELTIQGREFLAELRVENFINI